MLTMAAIGLCIVGSKFVYQHVMVSRIPIGWGKCSIEDVCQESHGRRLLVVGDNRIMNSLIDQICFDLDTPELRTIVFNNSVKCSKIPPSDELFSCLESQGVEPNWVYPLIVVKDGERIVAFHYTGPSDCPALTHRIDGVFRTADFRRRTVKIREP